MLPGGSAATVTHASHVAAPPVPAEEDEVGPPPVPLGPAPPAPEAATDPVLAAPPSHAAADAAVRSVNKQRIRLIELPVRASGDKRPDRPCPNRRGRSRTRV